MDRVDLARRLAAELPDRPVWVEPRAMLLSGHAAITGGASAAEGFVIRVLYGARSAIAVVGSPPTAAIAAAAADATEWTPLIAQRGNAARIAESLAGSQPAWQHERAIVHGLGRPQPLPALEGGVVRMLERSDSLEHLPPGLRFEMSHARDLGPVASVFVDGRAVSFCYPCWATESLWDVSVDTLEAFRGRSLAAHAFALMAAHMRLERRNPVWGATASNRSSLRLAQKLGFVPEDEIVVFSRGNWAFLTAGFRAP